MNRFQMKSPAGITFSMMLLYLVQWGAQYIGFNYLPIYINELPFATNSTVGLAIAVGAVATIFAQPIWGRIADRSKTKNRILFIALILEALVGLLFLQQIPNLWILLLCVILFYIPFFAPPTLIDTIVVENMSKVKVPFGMVRCFASGGAALMSFIFGMVSDMTNIKAFSIFSVFAMMSIIPMLLLPQTKGHARESGQKISYRKLLKNRKFSLFLFYGFFLFLCGSMFNTFFSIFFITEKGLNAGTGLFGIFMGVTVLLETAMIFFGSKLFARMNPYIAFIIPPIAGIFRTLILIFAQAPGDMLLFPIFHAMFYAPVWAKVSPYIQSVVPEEMRATGQSVWMIVTAGISPVIGSLSAGALADVIGMREMYGVVTVILAGMSVLFAVLFFRQNRLDKRELLAVQTDR